MSSILKLSGVLESSRLSGLVSEGHEIVLLMLSPDFRATVRLSHRRPHWADHASVEERTPWLPVVLLFTS